MDGCGGSELNLSALACRCNSIDGPCNKCQSATSVDRKTYLEGGLGALLDIGRRSGFIREPGLSHSRLVALAHPCAARHTYILYKKPLLQTFMSGTQVGALAAIRDRFHHHDETDGAFCRVLPPHVHAAPASIRQKRRRVTCRAKASPPKSVHRSV